MLDVDVLDRPETAALALDPVKAKILAALVTPGSAASVAGQVGLTRQKANYHLRALEEAGLVTPAEERHWGGLTERLMVATASSYVVSPAALGAIGADPARTRDHVSASYLIALAARAMQEVGDLWRRARRQDKRLATLSIDTVIRFRSATERAAFTEDLARAVAGLAAHYHDEAAPNGRAHRLLVAAYPAPDTVKA
ncbi:ArsR/SmtB family transcription factor [Pseudorhodoplanes sinuspersici]|uniref:Transcriptional regulator n=1 Tax=Pseudorhodoplanes sinuspersici TaxID=1235591 RepID=A0A1W6ZLU0_9HYPH|nr:helix-turn-helix domain-containing protein [Pseudorhodoplanes sinuspersici]ARP98383.1 transcriptional regulator [Pseudorhodoplanes sinuspersici]RKE66048.1 ArsR family transcriptional regulator [Pseudorhodoplanes sinuspersici]